MYLDQNSIYSLNIGGLFGSEDDFACLEDIFQFTFASINNRTDGWYDDLLPDTIINSHNEPPECDIQSSIHAFYQVKKKFSGKLDAIIGPRRSGDAIVTGMVTNEEQILQVTPTASASELSDKNNFPFFSRLVPPSNGKGAVGAMVAMLRSFNWSRVSIIHTDSDHATSFVKEFNQLWAPSEIASSQLFTLSENNCSNTLNETMVHEALKNLEDQETNLKSRVILLIAHKTEAYKILKIANTMNFQPDTIWVGSGSWTGRVNFTIPPNPGYIGITPYRNRDQYYQEFWDRFQGWPNRKCDDKENLPDYSSEYLVDSILAVLMAFNATTPKSQWKNTTHVVEMLRQLEFHGVSGNVSFTSDGDRKDPEYSVYNMQERTWKAVGTVGTEIGSLNLSLDKICFAVVGCNLTNIPLDRFSTPPKTWETWEIILVFLISFLCLILTILLYLFRRSLQKKKSLKMNMTELEKKMEKLQKIDKELLILDDEDRAKMNRKEELLERRQLLQDKPNTWTDSQSLLVEVPPDDDQYWQVFNDLQESMDDAYISKLWRIQNMSLWNYFSLQKARLSMNGIPHNERNVWHGTTSNDPAIIYSDKQDGFMVQYSRRGSWG
jgi:ABC-type branched-subunit amino acid transport system substrate-binding protein